MDQAATSMGQKASAGGSQYVRDFIHMAKDNPMMMIFLLQFVMGAVHALTNRGTTTASKKRLSDTPGRAIVEGSKPPPPPRAVELPTFSVSKEKDCTVVLPSPDPLVRFIQPVTKDTMYSEKYDPLVRF